VELLETNCHFEKLIIFLSLPVSPCPFLSFCPSSLSPHSCCHLSLPISLALPPLPLCHYPSYVPSCLALSLSLLSSLTLSPPLPVTLSTSLSYHALFLTLLLALYPSLSLSLCPPSLSLSLCPSQSFSYPSLSTPLLMNLYCAESLRCGFVPTREMPPCTRRTHWFLLDTGLMIPCPRSSPWQGTKIS